MKAIKPVLLIVVLLFTIMALFILMGQSQDMVVVFQGNAEHTPIEMISGKFQGSQCGMLISDLDFASQVVATDGRTWFFDDHGCMAAWISSKPFQQEATIWVKDLSTGEWIDGRQAWYSRTDTTPMSYGFGAYKDHQEGLIDFQDMQRAMLKGETLANLTFRKELLGS